MKINNVAINSSSKSSCGLFPISGILMPEESQAVEAPSLPGVLTTTEDTVSLKKNTVELILCTCVILSYLFHPFGSSGTKLSNPLGWPRSNIFNTGSA